MSRMFPRMDLSVSTSRRMDIRIEHTYVSGAPEALRGVRALFASDFHLRPGMSAEPIAEAIRREKPDLILLGGDYADTRKEALRLFESFRALRAPLGIFAVRGNNDAEAFPDEAELAQALNAFGAELLVNKSVSISGALIGGIDEYLYGQPDYESIFSGKKGFRILLSHYPVLPRSNDLPDIMLSGHTHGGQFNCLGLTPYAIGFERMGGKRHLAPKAVSGWSEHCGMRLLVSKGLGMSRIPVRIGVSSQIHVLKFKN